MSLGIDINDILSMINITPDIADSVANALAQPTSENIQAVVAAYGSIGQVVPPKLMAYLLKQNEERFPQDTMRAAAFPWLFLGGGILALSLSGKKRRTRRARR